MIPPPQHRETKESEMLYRKPTEYEKLHMDDPKMGLYRRIALAVLVVIALATLLVLDNI